MLQAQFYPVLGASSQRIHKRYTPHLVEQMKRKVSERHCMPVAGDLRAVDASCPRHDTWSSVLYEGTEHLRVKASLGYNLAQNNFFPQIRTFHLFWITYFTLWWDFPCPIDSPQRHTEWYLHVSSQVKGWSVPSLWLIRLVKSRTLSTGRAVRLLRLRVFCIANICSFTSAIIFIPGHRCINIIPRMFSMTYADIAGSEFSDFAQEHCFLDSFQKHWRLKLWFLSGLLVLNHWQPICSPKGSSVHWE